MILTWLNPFLRQNITPQKLACLPLWMQISFAVIFKNHVDLEWESWPKQFTNFFLAEIKVIFSIDMKEVRHAPKWLTVDPVAQGLEYTIELGLAKLVHIHIWGHMFPYLSSSCFRCEAMQISLKISQIIYNLTTDGGVKISIISRKPWPTVMS